VKSSRDSQSHFPVRDYSLAVQSAVSWLGDRYLLATPIAARSRSLVRRPLQRVQYLPQSFKS
jgi:hypothetical protein